MLTAVTGKVFNPQLFWEVLRDQRSASTVLHTVNCIVENDQEAKRFPLCFSSIYAL